MKLPHRRQFLHLAAGAAALQAVSQTARAPTRASLNNFFEGPYGYILASTPIHAHARASTWFRQ